MGLLRDTARALRLLRRQGPIALGRMALHQGRRAVALRRTHHPFLRHRPPVADLVGMTTPEEQSWLHWYAAPEYDGSGEIVDLGCWLGASTLALARGLAENRSVADCDGRIHAFDRFLWEEWMEESVAGTALAGRLSPGESFLPEFEARLGALRRLVVTHPGDLVELGWRRDLPIALLFHDSGKSWELTRAVVRDFYPRLVPGRSIVVEQDFAHFFTPWIHLLRHRFRDHFEPVLHVPFSGSMVFRQVLPFPAELLARPFGPADFTDQEIEEAFAASLALVEPPMRPNVWAARVMWEVHLGRLDEARRRFAEATRRGFRGLDLEKVRPYLDGHG